MTIPLWEIRNTQFNKTRQTQNKMQERKKITLTPRTPFQDRSWQLLRKVGNFCPVRWTCRMIKVRDEETGADDIIDDVLYKYIVLLSEYLS